MALSRCFSSWGRNVFGLSFRKKEQENPFRVLLERESMLRQQGWVYFLDRHPGFPPFSLKTVEATRDGEDIFILEVFGQNPSFNVGNLWWRPLNNIIDITPATMELLK